MREQPERLRRQAVALQNEQQRQIAEEARLTAERERQLSEASRQQDEACRAAEEQIRHREEERRQDAEDMRSTAESARLAAAEAFRLVELVHSAAEELRELASEHRRNMASQLMALEQILIEVRSTADAAHARAGEEAADLDQDELQSWRTDKRPVHVTVDGRRYRVFADGVVLELRRADAAPARDPRLSTYQGPVWRSPVTDRELAQRVRAAAGY